MRRLLLCLALAVAGAPLAAQDRAAPVWVNLRSGVYHCPGTEHYGRTTRGAYMAEDSARALGHRANGGQRCGRATAPVPPPAPAAAPRLPAPEPGPVLPREGLVACRVTRVVDGDTFDCEPQGRVRPIGIDAPEAGQEPFGTAATVAEAALLPPGTEVQLLVGPEARDRNGRLLAWAWVDGVSFNWLMVRMGWAVPLHYEPNTRYAAPLDEAERRAREERRGLWLVDGFACRPKDRREGRC
jgi:endonuclease YncB( thermonuclease family)